jgi:hypothetical protein
VGAAALCWSIWRCPNDIVFTKTRHSSFLQAIFKDTYWIHFWAQRQRREGTKELFHQASSSLEIIALELANHGWKHNNRLDIIYFFCVCFDQLDVLNYVIMVWPYTSCRGQI